jgi:hypothetical protein
MRAQPDVTKNDIVTAVLVEALVESLEPKAAKRYLAVLEKLIEHQAEMARGRVVRIHPSPSVDEMTALRLEAIERLEVILSLGRRIVLNKGP